MKKKDDKANIGKKIEAARVAKGWSRIDLAKRLKVSVSCIYKWESGENGLTALTANRLAKEIPELRQILRLSSRAMTWPLSALPKDTSAAAHVREHLNLVDILEENSDLFGVTKDEVGQLRRLAKLAQGIKATRDPSN